MKHLKVKVKSIKKLKENVFLLGFKSSYICRRAKPGQFLHIRIESPFFLLRRPFSIHKIKKENFYILFKVKGKGTKILSQVKIDSYVDMIGPLGRGFKIKKSSSPHILLGGGLGLASLFFLAQRLRQVLPSSNQPLIILGVKSKGEILCVRDLRAMGCKVHIATEDGSEGFRGKATDLLRKLLLNYPGGLLNLYACGPREMFLSLSRIIRNFSQLNLNCQISVEEFMGCGIGVCRGCVINTERGYKRVCKEGPVFNLREIYPG